jgi:hypothetical protein
MGPILSNGQLLNLTKLQIRLYVTGDLYHVHKKPPLGLCPVQAQLSSHFHTLFLNGRRYAYEHNAEGSHVSSFESFD